MDLLLATGNIGDSMLIAETFKALIAAPAVGVYGGAWFYNLMDEVVQAEFRGIINPAQTDATNTRSVCFGRHCDGNLGG